MTPPSLRYATYCALLTSIIFWLLFQLSKIPAIQNIAPFADDPYDAVASFAVQIAFVVALLSLARLVSIRDDDSFRQRVSFILHGAWLVFVCVAITLVVDFIAIALALPLTWSDPMVLLISGVVLLSALTILLGILLIKAQGEMGKIHKDPASDALAQTIGDCWTFISLIAARIIRILPFLKPVWNWIDSLAHRIADWWKKSFPFVDPAKHPWNFAMTFGVLLGFVIMVVILVAERFKEGPPPSLAIGLLLVAIFFTAETIAIFLSFLFFGGFLGLRPKLTGHVSAKP